MEISSSMIKLVSIVYSLTKESPLKKVSKQELEAAVRETNNLKYESYTRECLNRVLCHLESVYSQFEPSTWNFKMTKTASYGNKEPIKIRFA